MSAELKDKIDGRRVVASISGGKDSAAMSLWLTEQGIDHDRVFMDTGWEHEKTYEYLRGELTKALGPIIEINAGLTLPEHIDATKLRPLVRAAVESGNQMVILVLRKGMFASRVIRFCTEELKVFPLQRFINKRVDAGEEILNSVGIRREESKAREAALEWEWSSGFDCEVWRPLLAWRFGDVIDIHARHQLKPSPLYLDGALRVGCWPCQFSQKSEIRLLGNDPARIALMRELEADMTDLARQRDPGARERTFFAGRIAGRGYPIDEALEWSRTSRGGRQFEMFAADPADAGCMRWGLCETATENADGTSGGGK